MKFKITCLLFIALSLCEMTFAQKGNVTGIVTDNQGLPLIGVNVIVKETSRGVQTDFDGNYSIQAESGEILVFSFVGLRTKEAVVGKDDTKRVILDTDLAELDAVVVTALGIKARPRSVSTAIETVTSEDIENSGETNLANSLSSKAAGVNVISSSGSVGASSTIRIRGNTSINKSNSPLFVVDGVPIDNSNVGNSNGGADQSNRAIDINQADIASMDILKGTAAQTLYGLRAANGVILITTKKGIAGAPSVSITSTTQFSTISQVPELQNEFAQGRPINGVPTYRGPETRESFSWGPRISTLEYDGDTSYQYHNKGRLVPNGTGNGQPAEAYDHYDFFKTGILQEQSVSVRGGSEKMKYYISGSNLDQSGISPKEKFSRKSFRTDLSAMLLDNFEISASANFVNSGGRRVQRGSNISGVMVGIIRTTPTFDNANGLSDPANTPSAYELADGTQRSYRAGIYDNPYWTVAKNPAVDDVKRFIGRISFDYKPYDWATIRGSIGYDEYSDVRKSVLDINSASNPQGQVFDSNIFNEDINTQLLLLTVHSIGDKITINGLLGYDGFATESLNREVLGNALTVPGLFNLANTASQISSESLGRKKLDGLLFDARFAYDDMIFLNGTFRNDWSSTLPIKNNSFQSYSVGTSFIFTELWKNDVINYGKIRGSFGKTGNDAPIFATLTYYGAAAAGGDFFIDSNQFPLFSTVAFERSSQLGNPNIRPEQTREYELGTEVYLFDSRFKLDVTYYNKETTDQIIAVAQPSVTGYTSRIINAGIIENKGWEISGGVKIIDNDNFSWDIDANWTAYETTVVELAENVESITLSGLGSINSVAVPGQPYSSIFGTRFARNDNGEVIIGNDGFPIQDSESGIIGDPNPDWTMGLRNSFSYKNFSLSALLDIRKGGDVWCGTCEVADYFGTSKKTAEQRSITDFVFEGVNVDTGLPNTKEVAFADPNKSVNTNRWVRYGFTGAAEEYIYDSSWIRLREITLSYKLPRSIIDKTFLTGGSLTISGRNLFLITDYPGVDPETNLNGDSNGIGLDYFNQPNTKSYSLTAKFNF
ncbi:SusC/RagA family TonB-linked outer membrane protein [Gelidibacter salicanalis]|uniref:SusC/RagA family TonB-linked outer membrane protein n=1 Tax=Gelidibacter salicanalis TaxID=291193 RepID=A0A934KHG6_9FLAO|nr:SusC/RagA family TonB-linked outer membrane protein [Gelidibacter salicanalis]MBJ7879606.1 SusC/RagA family TonB-linked outer membrane protein [Gelidibacter salicanalis]